MDVIVFSVSDKRYALNIENVQRIIQDCEPRSIPNSNELIDGVLSYEDSIIKVLNFHKLLGLDEAEEYFHKFIIYENENSKFALKVDVIEDIKHITEVDLMNVDEQENHSDFLALNGKLDLDGVVINLIKTLSLPS